METSHLLGRESISNTSFVKSYQFCMFRGGRGWKEKKETQKQILQNDVTGPLKLPIVDIEFEM